MATRKVRYVGPHDVVEVRLPDGSSVTVEQNHQVELPEELVGNSAHGLLAQAGNWERVEAAPERRKGADE